MTVQMKEGTAIQKIPVMKLGNYSLEDIFNKNLLILILFHIFVYENKFMVHNSGGEELVKLKIEYLSREEFYRIREEGLAAGRSEGFSAGRSEGLAIGERKAYLAMFRKGILTLAEVARELNISEEAVKQYL